MKRILARLTYANVVATLALVLVIGGGSAFAASQFGRESIGTGALKKEAVTVVKLSKKAKAALSGPAGPRGASGPQGDPGSRGEKGAAGATNVTLRTSTLESVASGGAVQGIATCLPGERAVGGGLAWEEVVTKGMQVGESSAATLGGPTVSSWAAIGINETGATKHFQVTVVCASP